METIKTINPDSSMNPSLESIMNSIIVATKDSIKLPSFEQSIKNSDDSQIHIINWELPKGDNDQYCEEFLDIASGYTQHYLGTPIKDYHTILYNDYQSLNININDNTIHMVSIDNANY